MSSFLRSRLVIHRLLDDLIAVGRALISDPNWVTKVKMAKEQEIVSFDRSHLGKLL
jgi:2,4-dienoyl-CoA reductase-like NADH-dependent reductase (Old Yellow Enzyme family)